MTGQAQSIVSWALGEARQRIGEYGAGARIGVVGAAPEGSNCAWLSSRADQGEFARVFRWNCLPRTGKFFRNIRKSLRQAVQPDSRVARHCGDTALAGDAGHAEHADRFRRARVSVPRDALGYPGRCAPVAGTRGNPGRRPGIHAGQRPVAVSIPRKHLRCRRRGDHDEPPSPQGRRFRCSPGTAADPNCAPTCWRRSAAGIARSDGS